MEGFLCYFNAGGDTQDILLPRDGEFFLTHSAVPDAPRLAWNTAHATWVLKGPADGRVVLDGSPQVVPLTDEEGRQLHDASGLPRYQPLAIQLENLTEIQIQGS